MLRRFNKGSRQRFAAAQRLERIYSVAIGTGQLVVCGVGTFVTAKREPAMWRIPADGGHVRHGPTYRRGASSFDHAAAQAILEQAFLVAPFCSVGGEEQIADWQIKRDSTYRGIIEIVRRRHDCRR